MLAASFNCESRYSMAQNSSSIFAFMKICSRWIRMGHLYATHLLQCRIAVSNFRIFSMFIFLLGSCVCGYLYKWREKTSIALIYELSFVDIMWLIVPEKVIIGSEITRRNRHLNANFCYDDGEEMRWVLIVVAAWFPGSVCKLVICSVLRFFFQPKFDTAWYERWNMPICFSLSFLYIRLTHLELAMIQKLDELEEIFWSCKYLRLFFVSLRLFKFLGAVFYCDLKSLRLFLSWPMGHLWRCFMHTSKLPLK